MLVVRDDFLPGGTKQRVLPILMTGADEFVYASPVYGYAQVALAVCARTLNKKATIFCAKRKERYRLTLRAEAEGAKIVEVSNGYLSVVQARARDYCQAYGARLLPFGLDTPEFVEALADVAKAMPVKPREVWSVAASGVLTRSLQRAWPKAKFYGIRTGVEPHAGCAEVIQAPEKFEQDAKQPPPFPSCLNYDAKVWRFVKQRASPGALFWNVAG